jgi:diketogulonate reductase-like aldo/keto reductase
VSNFLPEHLDRLMADAAVVPAVNQIEVHPYFRNSALLAKNAELGILSQAWSPLGGITFYPGWGDGKRSTLDDPVLASIGRTHGKTPAQVMLRWHLQQGRQAIPKTVNPARMAENLDVFGFELTAQELAAIDALDTGVRGGPDPAAITLGAWAREIPEA